MDVLAANHAGRAGVQARQQQRLSQLLRSIAEGPTLYAEYPRQLHGGTPSLSCFPVFCKDELMQRFDEWVTDPEIRLPELQAFIEDPSRIAEPYLGKYTVWSSSGSGGVPGIFVQDAAAMAIYDALESLRRSPVQRLSRWVDPLYLTERIVFAGVINGHYASIVSVRRLQALYPWTAEVMHSASILQPMVSLVAELNAYAPTILSTYPTAATALAGQQVLGNLHIELREIWTGGETLSSTARRHLEDVFQCPVRDNYGASEFLSIAAECAYGHLHANSDWLVLEPVDEHYMPVPLGHASATTLLTHLGNHVQPIIRYDLGDQICVAAGSCPCGSPLPIIEVTGRNDSALVLRGINGSDLVLLPLALTTVLEEQAHLFDFQVRQQDGHTLELVVPERNRLSERLLFAAAQVLRHYVEEQGGSYIHIVTRRGLELVRGSSGKTPRVVGPRPASAQSSPLS